MEELRIPEWARLIFRRVIKATGAPAAELAGIAYHESGWDPRAVGDNGHSIGLTQLHDAGLGAGMSVEEREDPETNLMVAGRALAKRYQDTYDGDMQKAIAAHNAGDPQVMAAGDKWRGIAKGAVGKYVDTVQALAEGYQADVAELLAEVYPQPKHGREAIAIQLGALWGTAKQIDERTIPPELARAQIEGAVVAIKDHLSELP